MARLIPADKGTHLVIGALCALALLLFSPILAALGCLAAAVGREVYGWDKRGRGKLSRADATEAALDIGATLAGGAIVLIAAIIGT